MVESTLSGKTAIVTGAGSGMGAAAARTLAREGASVVLADVDRASVDAVVAGIDAAGGTAIPVVVDVRKSDDVRRMTSAALERFGAVDILACIAGVLSPSRVEDITEDEWRFVLDVNLTGVFLCAQAVLPGMKARRSGRIIVMASMAGRATSTLGGAHYTASKAGVLGLTRHLARETAPFGINVNAINPGIIDTPMVHTHTPPERLQGVIDGIPFKRMGTPDEVADLIVFLASEQSSYITGAGIDIHGGEIII